MNNTDWRDDEEFKKIVERELDNIRASMPFNPYAQEMIQKAKQRLHKQTEKSPSLLFRIYKWLGLP